MQKTDRGVLLSSTPFKMRIFYSIQSSKRGQTYEIVAMERQGGSFF